MVLPEPSNLIDSNEKEQNSYSVQEGDVFFTRTSETIEEISFSSVCTKTIAHATFAGFIIRFRPQSTVSDINFMKYFFRSNHNRPYFVKQMNIVIRASLNQELLGHLPVLLPSIDIQFKIASYLDSKCSSIDKAISTKEQVITKLEKYKKSLIYEYVTGKKEAPDQEVVNG
jgi:type I restriction enzyme S subunit